MENLFPLSHVQVYLSNAVVKCSFASSLRHNEFRRVGQFIFTKLATNTRTRNRQTYSIEVELDLDMQMAWNYN